MSSFFRLKRMRDHAILYPWRMVEHAVLFVSLSILLWIACMPSSSLSENVKMPPEGTPKILESESVKEAPPPTMSDKLLVRKGQMIDFHDIRGDIYRISMGGGTVVNLMYTVAGTLRSGDIHNCTQLDMLLKGRTRLHLMDVGSGTETVLEYSGENNFIAIPPLVPHLFEFMEDSIMIEWWGCEFHAWHYKPYRDRIQQAFEKHKELRGLEKLGPYVSD